jgi:hypothetical protein
MKLLKMKDQLMKAASLLLSLLFVFAFTSVKAQNSDEENFEKYQDDLYAITTYQLDYPDLLFDYNYNSDGELQSVTIRGVNDPTAEEELEVLLMDLHKVSDLLLYATDDNGIYYRTEERARFKDGKDALYQQLRANLTYPKEALDRGIEGVVQLRFVVDRWGNVDKLEAKENIDAADWIVDEMVKEAKNAFNRIDQDWIPGEIDDIEVPQWVILPVHFKISLPPSLQRLM